MDLHPHWDTTEQGETTPALPPALEGVPVAIRTPRRVPIAVSGPGRQIAAIVGIVVTVSIGLWQTDGWQTLGQLMPDWTTVQEPAPIVAQGTADSVTIRLTADGAVPSSTSVAAGGTINFMNESDIPYVLEAEGILGAETGEATVPFVFPGSTEAFRLSAEQPMGTYAFTSATDATLSITVTILPAVQGGNSSAPPLPPSSVPSDLPTDDMPEFPTEFPPMDDPLPQDPQEEMPVSSAPAANLPRNPYTVGAQYQHPFDEDGQPIEDLFNEDGTLKTGSSSLHGGAPITDHRPRTNTNTGPAVGITLAGSTLILWWKARGRKTA